MTVGEVVLVAALASGTVALVLPRSREVATRVHAALVLAALGLLLTDFLGATMSYRYTWDHTRVDYPWYYRLAGLWGGEAGTVLLWNAVVALTLLFVRERLPSKMLVAFSGALTLFNLLFGTFHATGAADLARAPGGRGLADVLLTPLMVIHPPIQFIGYGLMAVPAAYALASLWAPATDGAGASAVSVGADASADASRAWAGRAYPWARRAWLFATLGLALGALWAYYVLSFGGYWAWDPVETSNLLPWLALTALLHAAKQRMRGQGHVTAAPLLAYAAFILTLFATFATRSGLWVSVHAFTDPTDRFEPDAPARLLAILDAHLPTRMFFSLFAALLFAGVGVWAIRRLGRRYGHIHGAILLSLAGATLLAPGDLWGALFAISSLATPVSLGLGILLGLLIGLPFAVAFATSDEASAKTELSVRSLMAAAVVLLSVALGVAFLLNLQVVNGPERAIFDRRAPFIAVPIVTVVTLMLALAPLGKRGASFLAGGALAGGLIAAVLMPEARVIALATPLCIAAALAAVLKLAHVQGTSAPPRLRIGGALLMLGSILGLLLASNPPTYVFGWTLGDGASLSLGIAGMALSALGLVGSVAAFRARSVALAMAGCVAAALALGYGIGAIMALVALALIVSERRAFTRAWPEPVRIREMGIYVVHLAVVLGLLGYAASTYAQEREVFAGATIESTQDVGSFAMTLRSPDVEAPVGAVDRVTVPLAITREGKDLGREDITFEWRPNSATYSGKLDVRRGLFEDVYVRPMAFHNAQGWVGADSVAGAQATGTDIDAVTFSVSVLPLMSLVWASAWMMVLGMGAILASTRR